MTQDVEKDLAVTVCQCSGSASSAGPCAVRDVSMAQISMASDSWHVHVLGPVVLRGNSGSNFLLCPASWRCSFLHSLPLVSPHALDLATFSVNLYSGFYHTVRLYPLLESQHRCIVIFEGLESLHLPYLPL